MSVKEIHIEFIDESIADKIYENILEKKFLPWARKSRIIRNFYFMEDGAMPHRTKEVFEILFQMFCYRVIGLGYPKFANGGMEWPPYSPDLNPLDYFFGLC